MDRRTICYAEGCSCICQIVAQVVIEKTKRNDEAMEQYPREKEEAFTPLVDHPEVKLLSKRPWSSLGRCGFGLYPFLLNAL